MKTVSDSDIIWNTFIIISFKKSSFKSKHAHTLAATENHGRNTTKRGESDGQRRLSETPLTAGVPGQQGCICKQHLQSQSESPQTEILSKSTLLIL